MELHHAVQRRSVLEIVLFLKHPRPVVFQVEVLRNVKRHALGDLVEQAKPCRVERVVQIEDPGVHGPENAFRGGHALIFVPVPFSVNSSSSRTWGMRPSRM